MFEPGHKKLGGRQKGARNKRTVETIAKVEASGLMPLDVMLEAMREKYSEGDLAAAADRARDCAPYVHARLSSSNVAVRRITRMSELTDLELVALAGDGGTGDESVRPTALN